MFGGLPFKYFLLGCKEEADKGIIGVDYWVSIDGCVRGSLDVELDVLELGRGGYVISDYFTVLSWT